MDIGKNNYTFYDGYDGEPEIIVCLEDEYDVHIWDGYFDNIFENPPLNGKGWTGFTREYHQCEGIFSELASAEFVDTNEYLHDLYFYRDKTFRFEETSKLLEILIELFETAVSNNLKVKVEIK